MTEASRSHWGWGYTANFGADAERRALAQMACAMLQIPERDLLAPVALQDVSLPPARVEVPTELRSFVSDQQDSRIRHTYGRSFPEVWRGFQGDFRDAPDLVATPTAEDDLSALMDWAARERVALVPYGGGTSVVRGVTPSEDDLDGSHAFRGWVSVDLHRFDAIDALNLVDRTVRIGGGARGPAIEAALAAHGLTLRHFPQSFEFSTLGGWIATRAGGHFATNTTRIDDLVQSIRMVTPIGAWSTCQVPSTGAGPDPRQLILGSEGTLGFITSAVVKVRPRPVFRSKATVLFDTLEDAVTACRRITQAHLYPSNCRLLDRHEAMLNGVIQEPKNVLLLGFESADVPVDALLNQALAIAIDCDGVCPDGAQHTEADAADRGTGADERWKQAFLDGPYLQGRLLSAGIVADTFETAITWDRFDALHRDLRSTLRGVMTAVAGGGRLTLRFTHVYPDGPAPYYTFVFSADREDVAEAWLRVRSASADVLARHGATISHHHAVGRFHAPWWSAERSATFQRAWGAVKAELDPSGILNPGVLANRST